MEKSHVPLSLSERMARIRKVDTKPELVVRKLSSVSVLGLGGCDGSR
jgi:G:T-mismatch repair DNA endonuclease (very short patch repair protein)